MFVDSFMMVSTATMEFVRFAPKAFCDICMHIYFSHPGIVFFSMSIVLGVTIFVWSRPRSVYLVDFSCFRPPDLFRIPFAAFMEHSKLSGSFNEKSLEFQKETLESSGLGEQTYFPFAMHYLPPRPEMAMARAESELSMFSMLDELFNKTGVLPKDIGILVVNSSLFNPTPSMAAMIVNRYKMHSGIRSFNLGGMGCAAGLISVDLANALLKVHRNTYALVVSSENITLSWYHGNRHSMLTQNCLFRVGGAAILLSNKRTDRRRSKYQLLHIVRTHKGADDRAYRCAYQEEDEDRQLGVVLGKELMKVAGEALQTNVTTLGPLVLPFSERLLFLASLVANKFLDPRRKPYVPDFKLAFEHFLIHAGSKAVIDEFEKTLRLAPEMLESSRMTLYRFGNISSSSLWYELAYAEAQGKVKRGDRVLQIGMGSGYKCNSAVWKSLRRIHEPEIGPWSDCIHQYPI